MLRKNPNELFDQLNKKKRCLDSVVFQSCLSTHISLWPWWVKGSFCLHCPRLAVFLPQSPACGTVQIDTIYCSQGHYRSGSSLLGETCFFFARSLKVFSLPSEFRHFRRAGVKWRIASGGAFWYSRLVHPSGQKKIIPYLVWWLAICLCSLLEFPVNGYFHPLSILCMFHSPLLQISSVLRENSLTWPSESLTMSFSQFTAPNRSVHLLCVFLILRIACCSWISYFSEQLVFMDAIFTHISS